MENKFRTIVEQIFNNWTGLQLAVEHSMAGPNSKQVAIQCVDYMTQYCLNEPNVQISDIQEALEDIMDEEFDTMCEDNSPSEIASLLHRFLLLLKEGNTTQCDLEYQNLPTCKLWLSKPQPEPSQPQVGESSNMQDAELNNSSTNDVPMEQDSEWTEVKSRRKR